MSSILVLFITTQILGVIGTFPPVSNPPPIPGQAVRTLDISPQQFYIQEDFNQGPPQPNVRDGPFLSDNQNEQRWYIQERQTGESSENPSSLEDFDRFYPNGEPAIGPVATPMPDDTYIAQPSIVSKTNPGDGINSGSSDIWILSRGSDNDQFVPQRWVPTERVVEIVNQNSGPPAAADVVKSFASPVLEISGKNQFSPVSPRNIVPQIFVRSPSVVGSQKVLSNPPTLVQLQSVKQVVDIPQPNFKQVVQQQITKTSYPFQPLTPLNVSPPSPLPDKRAFIVPPPPPPPIKGEVVSPKVSGFPVNPAQGPNVLFSVKNGILQQLRHIWVPTSSRTGRFVTIPVSSVNSEKSALNKGVPLDTSPISVSDTWVLNTEGAIPSFQQQKSFAPPPVVQSGKGIFRDSSVIQVDSPPIAQIVSTVDSPKPAPFVNLNSPLNIWPARQDFTNSNILGKNIVIGTPAMPVPPPKSGDVIVGKTVAPPLPPTVAALKPVVRNAKLYPLPPQLSSPVFRNVNGKSWPIAPQKSQFPPQNTVLLPAPESKVITQGKQPLTRIIRVNRFPTGSYYLLNTRIRPNIVTYPHPSIFQQPKSGVLRVVQAKQFPLPVQGKQLVSQVPTKQIVIPTQQQIIASQIPSSIVAYSLPGRQIIAHLPPQKPSNRLIYPALQAIRYAYPLYGFINPSPTPAVGTIVPQSFKIKTLKSSSVSNPAESSSSEGSSEEKKEEPKKEEINESGEKLMETKKETEGKPEEKESVESKEESQSKEIILAAESQLHSQALENSAHSVDKPYLFRSEHRENNETMQHRQEIPGETESYDFQDADGIYEIAKYATNSDKFRVKLESKDPGTVTHDSVDANFISNKLTQIKSQTETV